MSLAKLGLGHSWYLNTHFLPHRICPNLKCISMMVQNLQQNESYFHELHLNWD